MHKQRFCYAKPNQTRRIVFFSIKESSRAKSLFLLTFLDDKAETSQFACVNRIELCFALL